MTPTTTWPSTQALPGSFDPAAIVEHGKNPGLGVQGLHSAGVTGKGINVAVIDKPLHPDHIEWLGRMNYIEASHGSTKTMRTNLHGSAAVSILAGSSTGVAPEANIYYFAVPDDDRNIEHYTRALLMIMQLNQDLVVADRIRVVSISDGCPPELKDTSEGQAWYSTLAQAETAGLHVVVCDRSYTLSMCVAGCAVGLNPDDPTNYEMGVWWQNRPSAEIAAWTETLLMPGDYRTYASDQGADIYHYSGVGGNSWIAPYLAGLYALGWQVCPDASILQLQEALVATAHRTKFGPLLVNPPGFIDYVTGEWGKK